MTTLAEIRQKHPEYADLSDQQLAEGLHKKFYSDMPFADFSQKVGYQAQPVAAPSVGGMGGFNPIASNIQADAGKVFDALGMTGKSQNTLANAAGPLEPLAQAGSGLLGMSAGGLAGIGQGLWNTVAPESMQGPPAADRVSQVQQALTYQPRTMVGAGMSAVAGAPGLLYDAGTTKAGEVVTDVTGSPAAGAAVKTGLDVAPWSSIARAMPKAGPRLTGDFKPTKNDVPTTEQLTAASRDAYKVGKESGVVVPAGGYTKALEGVRKTVTEDGIDPTLHPKSTAVMRRLEEANGKELTLQQAETLRKIALDAEDDLNPVTRQPTPDARLAGKIVDELDEQIDALSVNSPARELWSRSRRSQMIDQAIHRAEITAGANFTQSGFENALRNEFKQIARNPRRMRGLTETQKAAIEKVAKGGAVENTLRQLGKFDPTSGVIPALATVATGGGLALAGFGGRRAATAMTKGNVEKAREALVGRGTTSGGLLAKDNPKPLTGGPQGLLGAAPAQSRAAIRAQIQSLDADVRRLQEMGPAAATVRESVEKELARLRKELAAAESQGGSS